MYPRNKVKWWENLPKPPTIVDKVTEELQVMGCVGIITYENYQHESCKWKIVFETQVDMNLYKLTGKYNKDKRFKMFLKD